MASFRDPMPAARQLACRAAALAWLLSTGCIATIDNDDSAFFGDKHDRWYTAGARFERPAVAEDDGSLAGAYDEFVRDVAGALPLACDDPTYVTAGTVLGLEMYTPEDTDTSLPQPDDRPYAGYVYAGVVRRETTLDADSQRRHDVQAEIELDVGWVGPGTRVDDLQKTMHEWFGMDEPEGWDNQLDDEPALVMRGALRRRIDYGELGSLAWDLVPRVDGALGNIDTHVGLGGLARVGVNLSREFDPRVGELPVREDAPVSVFLFGDADGRYVLHNLFLEGNTFHDSLSVDEEPFVGELTWGLGIEKGAFRFVWARHDRSREFEGQDGHQGYGSFTVSWTPAP